MRIGLFGIGGVYNYGCEAIVRGTTAFINILEQQCHQKQKLHVVYYSMNYEYDSKRLADLGIEIIPVKTNYSFFKKIRNKLMQLCYYEGCELFYDYHKIIDDVDMLFFIGGDIYTIPAVKRENKKYRYANSLAEFGKKAAAKGIPIVLYGASVGPFGHYGKAVKYYRDILKTYRSIICRESIAIDYLQSLSLDNVIFSPDPAFLVNSIKTEESKKSCEVDFRQKAIGVNLSPLSLNELYVNGNKTQIMRMAALLKRIHSESGRDVLLLPHVISKDPHDNDADFMKKIVEMFDKEEKSHFSIADYSGGFLGIKHQMKNCEIVVSARMHCAINAIHENIPTIFLSYSQKSIGMCRYVYGDDRWVIDIKKADKELIPAMKDMLVQQEEISRRLRVRNIEIYNSIVDNKAQLVKQVLGDRLC